MVMQHNNHVTDMTHMGMTSDFFGSIEERKSLTLPGTNEFSSKKKTIQDSQSTRKNSLESTASTIVASFDNLKKFSSSTSSSSASSSTCQDDTKGKGSFKAKAFLSKSTKT